MTAQPLVHPRTGRPLDADGHLGHYGPGRMEGYGEDYGIAYREGLLAEHVAAFVAAGGEVRHAASGSGRAWAVRSDGKAVPVVCGDLIMVNTEDGPQSGRCGEDALDEGMCPAHAADWARYSAMCEPERYAMEREAEYAR